MTPKRPNILRRALSALAVISGREQVTTNLVLKKSEDYPIPSDLPKKKKPNAARRNGPPAFISNNTSKIQTGNTGFFRVLVRGHKACGLRRCDSEGKFINRKTGWRITA